jgi:hypothetical protein
LWSEIFLLCCLIRQTDTRDFVAQRNILRAAHDGWSAAVDSTPAMWRCIEVTLDSTVTDTRDAIARVIDGPLDIRVFLDTGGDPRYDDVLVTTASLLRLDTMRQCLELLASRSDIWRNVELEANDYHHGRLILDAVSFLLVPRMEVLSLSLPSLDVGDYPHAGFFSTSLTMFDGNLPRLTAFSLYGAALPWEALGCFASLNRMTFDHISSYLWPSATEFADVLASAVALRNLSIIGSFGLRQMNQFTRPLVSLPHLKKLHLSHIENRASPYLTLFLHRLHLPAFTTLRLSSVDQGFLNGLGQIGLSWPVQIDTLALSGYGRNTLDLRIWLRGVRMVSTLLLAQADPVFFNIVRDDIFMFPTVDSLSIGATDLKPLLDYVSERLTYDMPIRTLHFYHDLTRGPSRAQSKLLADITSSVAAFITYPTIAL